MNYQSPITMYTRRIIKDIAEKQDEYLMEEVRKVGFDINKEELAKALKYDRDQYMRGYTDGRMYKPPIITNEDKIRAMTREELADFICGIFTLEEDVYGNIDPRTVVTQEPRVEVRNKGEMLDWLQQEVAEE